MKNTPGEINNRLETKEEKISQLEDLATEVICNETHTHKPQKKKKTSQNNNNKK